MRRDSREYSGHHLAVRTYGKLFVFDVKGTFMNPTSPNSSSVQLSVAFVLEREELDDRKVMDMFLFDSTPAELCVVVYDGTVYHCAQKGEHKAM